MQRADALDRWRPKKTVEGPQPHRRIAHHWPANSGLAQRLEPPSCAADEGPAFKDE